ncbi:MAG: hypothetical protein ABJE10_08685 [bacterium]
MSLYSELRARVNNSRTIVGLCLLTIVLMIGCNSDDKKPLHGAYTFDATGNFEGHFSGIASAQYTHPLSGAGYHYKIVMPLDIPRGKSPAATGFFLIFVLAEKPKAGTISLKKDERVSMPRVSFGGRADEPIAWSGVDGELRIERDPIGGDALKGEFWAKFVQNEGGPRTNTMQVRGSFDTK